MLEVECLEFIKNYRKRVLIYYIFLQNSLNCITKDINFNRFYMVLLKVSTVRSFEEYKN